MQKENRQDAMRKLETKIFEDTVSTIKNHIANGTKNKIGKAIYIFDKICVDDSGCGSCKTKYPAISVSGRVLRQKWEPFEAQMDSWNFHTCRCPALNDDFNPAEKTGIDFYVYIGENHSTWYYTQLV
jgi:hypothetical protein